MTLPDRISVALSSGQPRIGSLEYRRVARGDVRQVESSPDLDAVVRLALVLTVDSDKGSVEIVLVHPYAELATEADLVFSSDETEMAYPIVAQTRVRSVVWINQMLERVGRLSEDALKEFGQVTVAADPFAVSSRTGPPLAGPVDSRWRFKRQEAETLNQLAADRIAAVFEDGPNFAVFEDGPNFQRLSLVSISHAPDTMDDLKAQTNNIFDLENRIGQLGRDLGRDSYNSNRSSLDRIIARAA